MLPRQTPLAGLNETFSPAEPDENAPLKERLLDFSLLYSLSKTYNLALQAADLLESTAEFLRDTLRIDNFCIMQMDRKNNELKAWRSGEKSWGKSTDICFLPGKGISGMAALSGETILVQDMGRDEHFRHHKGKGAMGGSFLSAPILTDDGQVLGVLNIHKTQPHAFRDSDKDFFSALANNLAQALQRARSYECALKKSMHDDLTRLYNRRFFRECAEHELSKARRNNEPLSLLLLDLDFFKSINDRYGHAFGDQVLEKMAAILKDCGRQSDVVARYGGEEFVALLPDTNQRGAWHIAEKIRSRIEEGLVFSVKTGGTERITATIGTASFPEAGATVAEMLKAADRRLYLGKNQGRNQVVGSGQDPALPENSGWPNDRRRHVRYQTALRIAQGCRPVHAIDIGRDNQWTACTVTDASIDGFHSLVGFAPQIGASYPCRVVNSAGPQGAELFTVLVRHVEALENTRFLMGVQVEKKYVPTWEKLYQSIIH